MVSLRPDIKISSDGKLMSDEAHVTLEILPLRCFIYQSTLRFIREFFTSEEDKPNTETEYERPPDLFFPKFLVKPLKVKVDYRPHAVDTTALKDGSYIELMNLLPLEEMVLYLKSVEMQNLTGWGSIISELICRWIGDVASTQIHKFLTRTTPLHPIANVGDGMKKFVMIPLEEYKQRGNVRKGFRRGTKNLAEVVAYETLNVSAKLTGFAAKTLKRGSEPDTTTSSATTSSGHAVESISKGFKEANAKIIIMPYREFHKTGAKGAMRSVVKGIPVAIAAPLSGAAEALSYGLVEAKNHIRPDLKDEDCTNSNHFE